MTVGTDFAVPDPERVLEAIGAAGYEGTDLGPPGYLGEGDVLAERLAANRLQIVGGFVPMRFSERERGRDRASSTRSTCSTRPARPARAPCCATPAAPSGSPTPAAAARTPRLRLDDAPLADAGRRRRARGRARARARLRAGLPPPHVDLRRGRAGDRALPRGHRRRRCCSTRGHLLVAGGDPVQALADWGDRDRRDPHQGRAARRCSSRSRPSAPTRSPPGAAGCSARSGRATSTSTASAPRSTAATTAGSSSSRTACSTTSPRSRAPPHEQVANRDWLREHAGW